MAYSNIPHEMRHFNQWVLWKYEDEAGATKPTKVPFSANPHSFGRNAAVNDPGTWASFDACVAVLANRDCGYDGLGFVLSETDPYVFIDLDDTNGHTENLQRQIKVYETFATYSEYSPSGKGLHLIGRGSVPLGAKRSSIEIYSKLRFMTMTGNRYGNSDIRDVSDLALTLYGQMKKDAGKSFYDPKAPQTHDDMQIMDMAANAENSSLFLDLYNGNWQNYYQSQSEADLAFINIVAFYTQNREQITRLFHNSALGKRRKAHRSDYLNYNISKAFDQLLPPVDIEGLAEIGMQLMLKERPVSNEAQTGLSAVDASQPREETPKKGNGASAADPAHPGYTDAEPFVSSANANASTPLHLRQEPPGLLGQIAKFIYQQAPRQVPEIALVGAIGLMAGLCGRCYNVSGQGLNVYLMLLAGTGVGKEAMHSGIDKLVHELKMQIPRITEYFGPSDIASGQALKKRISSNPCFVSIVGEVDALIRNLSNPNASSHEMQLNRSLRDLYHKSGAGRYSRGTIYSDEDKNIDDVARPAFSMVGEATPAVIFKNLSEDLILNGFLPRWTIIEYTGGRMPLNPNAGNVKPSEDLIEKLAQLSEYCIRMNDNDSVVNIQYTPDGLELLNRFDKDVDHIMNSRREDEILVNLYNRAHIKALKIASLIAVGINPFNPVIDLISANYAIELVKHDIGNLFNRFAEGRVGAKESNDEIKQRTDVLKTIYQMFTRPFEELASYGITRQQFDDKIAPHTYIARQVQAKAAFRLDRLGATAAIKRTIVALIDEGILVELNKADAKIRYNSSGKAYAVQNASYIADYGRRNGFDKPGATK